MSQSAIPESPPTPPSPPPERLYWFWMIGFIIGMLVGQGVGELVGAGYAGVGAATGAALGRWIGFGIGCWLGSVLGTLAGAMVRPDPLTARGTGAMIGMFALIYGALAAAGVVGEVLGGRFGGIAGSVLAAVVYIVIAALFHRSRSLLVRRSGVKRMETLGCECRHLNDLAVVPRGHHEEVFRTLDVVRHRGLPWWWLYASTCSACGQTWLVADEKRHNDLFILRRLDKAAADRLMDADVWPPDFDRFETLLEIGRAAGHSVRFLDAADSLFLRSVTDLTRERPGISVSEMAALLNLDPYVADRLAHRAVESAGVVVTFDIN